MDTEGIAGTTNTPETTGDHTEEEVKEDPDILSNDDDDVLKEASQ